MMLDWEPTAAILTRFIEGSQGVGVRAAKQFFSLRGRSMAPRGSCLIHLNDDAALVLMSNRPSQRLSHRFQFERHD